MKKLMTAVVALGLVAALAVPALARGGNGRGAGGAMTGGGGMGSGMSASEREAFRAENRARNQASCPNAGTGTQAQGRNRAQMRTQIPPPAAPETTTPRQ